MADPTATGPAPTPPPFSGTVTILFTDIRGYTAFTNAHGDEASFRILEHHNAIVREQFELYRGHTVKGRGDGFMVSFGAARNALACAMAIQRALDRDNRERTGATIQVGIGITVGEPIEMAGDFYGTTVNLASRMCDAAGPGQIFVAATVRQIVGLVEGISFIDRGRITVKGFDEPQPVDEVDWWSAVGATRPSPAAERAPAPAAPEPAPTPPRQPAPAATRRGWWLGLGAAGLVVAALVGLAASGQLAAVLPGSAVANAPTAGPATTAPTAAATAAQSAPTAALAAVAPNPTASSAASPAGGPGAVAVVLQADDFGNPATGLFRDRQQGRVTTNLPTGEPATYSWEYLYLDHALVGRIKGPYPENGNGLVEDFNATTADPLNADATVEVAARATASAGQVRYGLSYALGQRDTYLFYVEPASGTYTLWSEAERKRYAQGPSSAIHRAGEANTLRLELRGDELRLWINGQAVDRVQNAGFARRGGRLRLHFALLGVPDDGQVEVRFTNYRVLAVGP